MYHIYLSYRYLTPLNTKMKLNCIYIFSSYCARIKSVSVIKTNQLKLYKEAITVCSEICTKHINKLCGWNLEFLNVECCGTYSDLWVLQGSLQN
jgi:hypothetical protein